MEMTKMTTIRTVLKALTLESYIGDGNEGKSNRPSRKIYQLNPENSIRLAMIFTTGKKIAPPTATPPVVTLSDITYEQDV
ncbi:hypothetical protein V1477_020990 [Vespula maculifrons]|uniref:Uncharacterized protein n=1 Tax=Vespula maculifrons TaxID=7453 RepID=A0ABD2AQJ4_VESMC